MRIPSSRICRNKANGSSHAIRDGSAGSPPNAYGYGPLHGTGTPRPSGPFWYGNWSNTLKRTPISSPGASR